MTEVEEWLNEWIDKYGDHLVQFARAYTPDFETAQDIVQEVFVRLYRERTRRPNRVIHAGWLYTVAHRIAIDHHRKRNRDATAWAGQHPADMPPDLRMEVGGVLAALPDLDRELLFLFYYQDWTLVQLAQHYAIPVDTVKSRLYRARDRFRRVWKES